MTKFPRLFTAMVTPFNEDLSIDFDAAQKLALSLIESGSPGLVVCGTTGESPTLSVQEKFDLFKAIKEAVGNKGILIAGTGTNSTADCIKLTEGACKVGVDGHLIVVPYYNKPSQEGLYQHYKAVALATDLPIMMYNIPSRTGINMLPETVARLAEIPNIVGLKESCGVFDQISTLKLILPEEFLIYSGDDSLTLPMLSLGCYGVVSVASHIVAKQIKQMIDAYVAGNVEESWKIHLQLFNLFRAMFVTVNPTPVKKALSLMNVINSSKVRLPLVEASEAETKVILEALLSSKLLA